MGDMTDLPDIAPSTIERTMLASWLFDRVCPFWMDAVIDPQGGYFEALDADGNAVHGTERSLLNQARLTYVFSHAYCLRPTPALLAAAVHGFDFLSMAAERAAGFDGWYRVTDRAGTAIDAAGDAYDHAFVILAMAWYYRATANPQAALLAERAYAFLETALADPDHGGFHERIPFIDGVPALPRRQNPHMHLLKACLAMLQTTGEPVWLARADKLVTLFRQRFLDPRSDTVIEFFGADWQPATGAAGARREPGHGFEWSWLLRQYGRHCDDAAIGELADRLFAAGVRNGLDRDDGLGALVVDAIDADGKFVETTKLLWPQTEYIKAALARLEFCNDQQAGTAALTHIAIMRERYFHADGASWANQLARDGTPLQAGTPARVLYHLFLAIAEAFRVLPAAPHHIMEDHNGG